MPSVKKLFNTSSSSSPKTSTPTETSTTITKTTISPNGTKIITRKTTKATNKQSSTKSTPKSKTGFDDTSASNDQDIKDSRDEDVQDGVEIVGPGSDPRTNKHWMGDGVPMMGKGMVPAIIGEEQLSAEEMAKMGVVPQGRWVRVGTVKTVKRTVRKVKVEEQGEVGSTKENKMEKKAVITGRGVKPSKDKNPEREDKKIESGKGKNEK